jgi:hypothetical protein
MCAEKGVLNLVNAASIYIEKKNCGSYEHFEKTIEVVSSVLVCKN